MYALLITYDGRGGKFYESRNGDTLVAINELQKRYLENIARLDYPSSGQLVDLGTGWPHSVTTVAEEQLFERIRYMPPPEVLEYDRVA